ncbi:hypothetical protein [Methylobacterium sp. Leaf93]|uniref:hypothetical protein n=1 Tax=Methylobacterium sp. Leaf93 TaxID=1736249 RepID=UPI0006FEE4B3|nr:hypothetical protein [Methylobacterium sp. Leaf93]KQP04755.1 hypothetical protein ASF26_11605 [Methylobacterium sp. Leaf93]
MRFRFLPAAVIAASMVLGFATTASAKDPVAAAPEPAAKDAKELTVGQSAARERQKKCGAEWRALSVADKAAQGPKWPQYFSKCVKRLKEIKA